MALAGIAPGVDPRPQGVNLQPDLSQEVGEALFGLESWLDSLHLPGGYGGPVVGLTSDCLDYVGPGLDWRYEAIIAGYLNLWHATSNPHWLEKARLAGDDLVAGQLPAGNFRNSAFEKNPNTGGVPHEAAACIGLLRLALALRSLNDPGWSRYFQAARLNLTNFHIRRLWDERARNFQDGPNTPSVSANAQATIAEALFLLTRASGEPRWAEEYAFPALDTILSSQVTVGPQTGAVHFRNVGKQREPRFYPLLMARSLAGLLQGYAWNGDVLYLEAARRTARFLASLCRSDGSFPPVIYTDGKTKSYPSWVAPLGEILRILLQARWVGVPFDVLPSLHFLLAGSLPNGAILSGTGFRRVLLWPRRHDPRDQLPTCAWCGMSFRFLAALIEPADIAFEDDQPQDNHVQSTDPGQNTDQTTDPDAAAAGSSC